MSENVVVPEASISAMATVVPSLAGPKRPQDRVAMTDMRRAFDEAHHQVFEFGGSGGLARAEIVSFRLGSAVSPGTLPALREPAEAGKASTVAYFDGGEMVDAALWQRAALKTILIRPRMNANERPCFSDPVLPCTE